MTSLDLFIPLTKQEEHLQETEALLSQIYYFCSGCGIRLHQKDCWLRRADGVLT